MSEFGFLLKLNGFCIPPMETQVAIIRMKAKTEVQKMNKITSPQKENTGRKKPKNELTH